MGTRHIITVKKDRKTKLQNYGQWDGYPTGQGKEIAEFIQNKLNLEKFKEAVNKLKFLSDKQAEKNWEEKQNGPKHVLEKTVFQNSPMAVKCPELHRDTGAKILRLIQDGVLEYSGRYFKGDEYFEKPGELQGYSVQGTVKTTDKSWCEYEYIINLDSETVTVIDLYANKKKRYKFQDFTADAMEKLDKQWSED